MRRVRLPRQAICDVSLVGCSSDVRTEAHALVEASCTVLREMSSRLLPVPSRPHYLFSVRDLARVFQGIMTASKDAIVSPESFAVLWYHETMRSMFDKLLDPSLRHWFLSLLTKVSHYPEQTASRPAMSFGLLACSASAHPRLDDHQPTGAA